MRHTLVVLLVVFLLCISLCSFIVIPLFLVLKFRCIFGVPSQLFHSFIVDEYQAFCLLLTYHFSNHFQIIVTFLSRYIAIEKMNFSLYSNCLHVLKSCESSFNLFWAKSAFCVDSLYFFLISAFVDFGKLHKSIA